MTTVDQTMRAAAQKLARSATPMLDARVLMKAALGLDDAGLIAISERSLSAEERARFDAMVERRLCHEPVAHIVGRREFWSLDIEVDPGILVPRTDSETLIEAVLSRRGREAPLAILDLGCGSGALLCALLSEMPAATGLAIDIDPRAVAVTRRNLRRLGFSERGEARIGDWLTGLDNCFDVIVANPPYIPAGERETLPREVREHESEGALFAGEDGLSATRRILNEAPERLAPDGLLVLEFGAGQAEMVKAVAIRSFPRARAMTRCDLAGRPRALVIDLRLGRD